MADDGEPDRIEPALIGVRPSIKIKMPALGKTFAESVTEEAGILALRAELKGVNEKLWEVEDELRRCERLGDFGERFVELARSVCRYNDTRTALKAKINHLLNSPIAEQKEYAGCMPAADVRR